MIYSINNFFWVNECFFLLFLYFLFLKKLTIIKKYILFFAKINLFTSNDYAYCKLYTNTTDHLVII